MLKSYYWITGVQKCTKIKNTTIIRFILDVDLHTSFSALWQFSITILLFNIYILSILFFISIISLILSANIYIIYERLFSMS